VVVNPGNSRTTPKQSHTQQLPRASRAMVAAGRDLLLQRRSAAATSAEIPTTVTSESGGDHKKQQKVKSGNSTTSSIASLSPRYTVNLAKLSERRQILWERMKQHDARDAAMSPTPSSSKSYAAAATTDAISPLMATGTAMSPTPTTKHMGVHLGQHGRAMYLTSASCESVLRLLKGSGQRLQLGRNFVLTATGSSSGGTSTSIIVAGKEKPNADGGTASIPMAPSNIEAIAASYCKAVEVRTMISRISIS